MCKEIEIIDKEQNNKSDNLDDYSFVEDKNTFYLKIPPEPNRDVSKLRQLYEFRLAVTDIFSQALTLEIKGDKAENLISLNRNGKETKIKDECGSDAWEHARKLLLSSEEINKLIYKFFIDNGLEENLYEKIHKIDFSDGLSSEENETLIEALKEISKDIDDLNKLSDVINIDIRINFVQKTKEFVHKNLEKYCYFFYIDAKNKGLEAQFWKKYMELQNYAPDKCDFENSVSVDENTESFLMKKFPELRNDKIEIFNINGFYNKIHDIHKENESKIKEKIHTTQEDFNDFIQKEPNYDSLLYFDLSDEVINEICQKLEERKESEAHLSQDLSDNDVVSDNDKNASALKTSTVERELELRDEKQKKETIRTPKSKKDYQKRNRRIEEAGKKAEEIAYNELKKTYPNLIWHSENTDYAADINNIPFEDGEKIICDMWNRDAENTYFEVKAATDEFIMSVNEYNSMKKHSENYEVVLVDIVSCKISRHKFNKREPLRKDYDYIFQFNIKKEG